MENNYNVQSKDRRNIGDTDGMNTGGERRIFANRR